jgi:hypothetical protein
MNKIVFEMNEGHNSLECFMDDVEKLLNDIVHFCVKYHLTLGDDYILPEYSFEMYYSGEVLVRTLTITNKSVNLPKRWADKIEENK